MITVRAAERASVLAIVARALLYLAMMAFCSSFWYVVWRLVTG